jgi:hypothetical protein
MRLIVLAAAIAFVPATAFAGVDQLLVNPGLEWPSDAPSTSDLIHAWTLVEPSLDSNGAAVNSATFASFANHTPGGDRGLWLRSFEGGFGADAPATVDATLYQDIVIFSGVEYTLSAWFRFEANYTSAATLLTMQFLDSEMNEIATTTLDINTLNANDGVWREFSIATVAMPGSIILRSSVSMVDGQNAGLNPQSAFVDDFTLSAFVPAPGASAVLALGLVAARRRR